ncbi:glycosidase, partial [Bacillus sp. SIMBA_069]
VLLDKQDPSKTLARSSQPLIRPNPSEREGYVPNVVYTCGAMRHGNKIILPYAVSDTFCHISTILIADLISSLTF